MSRRVQGLGRGLGALIPTSAPAATTDSGFDGVPEASVDLTDGARGAAGELASVPGLTLKEVAVDRISPNPRQPRAVFDPDALAELAHSLKDIGFLQPVVARPAGSGFEIVAGERRWRAAQVAGLATVPVLVRETADDDLLRDALLENLHRVQLNPLEEAAAYQQLLEDFGCTQEDLAGRIGRSRPAVSNSLRLLRLPAGVQRRVAAGVLSAGHAKALAGMADTDQMEALATRIVAEGLSVRAVEEAITLGEADSPTRKRRKPRTSAHGELAADLSDRFETRVRISGTKGRGRITVDFASPEDLARIVTAMRDPATWS